MKSDGKSLHARNALMIFFFFALFGFMIPPGGGPQPSSIIYWPQIDVTLNLSNVVGVNNLSLGFMLGREWKSCLDSSVRRDLVKDANFKLIRFFSHHIEPCTYWNETARTGTFDWADVDLLVQKVFEIGAEPLICIGFYYWTENRMLTPPGMVDDPDTGLPYAESFGAYAAEWVKHFKVNEVPVRYYEVVNEPSHYFGLYPSNITKLAYYVELFNAAARSMRQENPDILISQDTSTVKSVFDYWLQHGDDIDYLDLHKYDSGIIGQYTEAEMLNRAESWKIETSYAFYSIDEARQEWFYARGEWLPVIISESNFNSAYENGTDPRIQQVIGTVWVSLVLRRSILKGFSYYVYNGWHSSSSKVRKGEGLGFGMIDSDNDQPWYPYYLQKMLGNSLSIGDPIVEATSSSDDLRSVAWINNETLNVMLISMVDNPRTVYLSGIARQLNFSKIDKTVSDLTPFVQTGDVESTQPLYVEGYTVILLQTSL